jgi:homoaconitate hydratase family protein
MGMTITEKIIAGKTNVTKVWPGEIYDVPVDLAYVHDNNAPITLKQFNLLNLEKVWDAGKVYFTFDHHSPSSTSRAAQHQQIIRQFSALHGIRIMEVGRGVCHPVIAEERLAKPGSVIVATDSHTVGLGAFGALATGVGSTEMAAVFATGKIWLQVPQTVKVILNGHLSPGICPKDVALLLLQHFGPSFLNYKAMEIEGSLLKTLTMEERMAITIMGLEMGLKNVIMQVDDTTRDYMGDFDACGITADSDAHYLSVTEFDVNHMEPMVATPGLPTNGVSVSKIAGIPINQATLGSCAGAFYYDLVHAADIVKEKKVHPQVRFIVVPNTSKVYQQALTDGVLNTLVTAGAIISSPSCGTCAGYEIGCLAPGEVCISTTTRNMDGRMGAGGEIYLASPRTVAMSAILGYIADPRQSLGGKTND